MSSVQTISFSPVVTTVICVLVSFFNYYEHILINLFLFALSMISHP